jgi:hypothetical protein
MFFIRRAGKLYAQLSKEEWVSIGKKHFKLAEHTEWWKNFLKEQEEKNKKKDNNTEEKTASAKVNIKDGTLTINRELWAEIGRKAGFVSL